MARSRWSSLCSALLTLALSVGLATMGHAQTNASRPPASVGSADEAIGNISSIFLWTTEDFPGAPETWGYGINSEGDIAGVYSPNGASSLGFMDIDGTGSTLNCPGSEGGGASGINDSDEVVGDCSPNSETLYGYLYSQGTYTIIQFPGAYETYALGVNNASEVVGSYISSAEIGFTWQGGEFTGYVAFPGGQNTWAEAINNEGQIVGSVTNYDPDQTFGFSYSEGNYQQIVVPGSTFTWVSGVNDYGEIVGQYEDTHYNDHGFLYWQGVFTRIEQPQTLYQSISGINNSGSVVGYNNSKTNTLVGTLKPGPGVLASPAQLKFGDQLIGTTSSTQQLLITDSGAQPLDISGITVAGPFVITNACPSMLPPAASCYVSVAFRPGSVNAQSGAVTLSDNAANSPQTIPLDGRGTQVGLAPGSLNFQAEPLGQSSAPRTVTLTNTGTDAVNLNNISIDGSASADFAQTNTCGSSVAPGGSCTISVTFTPTARGSRMASLSVSDNGGGSPQMVRLGGVGTWP
jgi:Abnormal spindle-like microcephaly-assoc'd, ASPM-SPD-2-Hydin